MSTSRYESTCGGFEGQNVRRWMLRSTLISDAVWRQTTRTPPHLSLRCRASYAHCPPRELLSRGQRNLGPSWETSTQYSNEQPASGRSRERWRLTVRSDGEFLRIYAIFQREFWSVCKKVCALAEETVNSSRATELLRRLFLESRIQSIQPRLPDPGGLVRLHARSEVRFFKKIAPTCVAFLFALVTLEC